MYFLNVFLSVENVDAVNYLEIIIYLVNILFGEGSKIPPKDPKLSPLINPYPECTLTLTPTMLYFGENQKIL